MNAYIEGKTSQDTKNPYDRAMGLEDREDRIYREVCRRRWQAGKDGRFDPYPESYAG